MVNVATLFVCANCSHETFNQSDSVRHARGTKKCPAPCVKKVKVKYSVPRVEDLVSKGSCSIEDHLSKNTILVEDEDFGNEFVKVYGIDVLRDLLTTVDPVQRAIRLFDMTLSCESRMPQFWNWVEVSDKYGPVVVVYELDDCTWTRHVDKRPKQSALDDLTFRMFQMVINSLCLRPPEGTEKFNNEDTLRRKLNAQMPGPEGLVYEQVHRYKPWMSELKEHIRNNLPKQHEIFPIQRSLEPYHVFVVDTGARTVTAWVCSACERPFVQKSKAKRHLSKCRSSDDGSSGSSGSSATIFGVRVKYERMDGEIGVQEDRVRSSPSYPKPIPIRPRYGSVNERLPLGDQMFEEHPELIEQVTMARFPEHFGELFKFHYRTLYGVDARDPKLHSSYTFKGYLFIQCWDPVKKIMCATKFPRHGGILIGYLFARMIYQWQTKVEFSAGVRLLDQAKHTLCFDCGLTWGDFMEEMVGMRKGDVKDIINLPGSRFRTFCDELLQLTFSRDG